MNRHSNKILTLIAAGLLLGVSTLTAAVAAKESNQAPEKGKESISATAVAILGQASELVSYARDNESPTAMLAAVEMIRRVRLTEDKAAFGTKVTEPEAGATAGRKESTPASSFNVAGLLAEAKGWANSDARLTALIDAELARSIPASSGTLGARGGAKYNKSRVEAKDTDRYTMTFVGGEIARVVVSGDGDTDLDLYIYDEDGNLITKDDDYTDDCIVQWTPKWTGKFTISIKNRGTVYNEYEIATN